MARKEKTAAELDSFADRLADAAKAIREAAKVIREAEMPVILLHSEAKANTFLPYIETWAAKMPIDARAQARAFQEGRQSREEFDRERQQKSKAALKHTKARAKK